MPVLASPELSSDPLRRMQKGFADKVVAALAAESQLEKQCGAREHAAYCWVVRTNEASIRLLSKLRFRNVERNIWAIFYPPRGVP